MSGTIFSDHTKQFDISLFPPPPPPPPTLYFLTGKKTIADLKRLYYCLRERIFCGLPHDARKKALEGFAVDVFGHDRRIMDSDRDGSLK